MSDRCYREIRILWWVWRQYRNSPDDSWYTVEFCHRRWHPR